VGARRFSLLFVLLLLAAAAGACGKKRPIGLGVGDLDAAIPPDVSDLRADDLAAAADAGADTRAVDAPAAPDAGPRPAGCPPSSYVDVCGCGCCGLPQSTVCYYPALGDSPATIPDPRPPDCSAVGCSLGVRHVCCDAQVPTDLDFYSYCAYDPATDLPRVVLVQRQSAISGCATVTLVRQPGANPEPTSIPGWSFESGRLGTCGDPSSGLPAIGALGTASLVYTGSSATFTAHLVLFTASASGPVAAEAHRMTVLGLPLSTGACPF
jgi:hypothetical protein